MQLPHLYKEQSTGDLKDNTCIFTAKTDTQTSSPMLIHTEELSQASFLPIFLL